MYKHSNFIKFSKIVQYCRLITDTEEEKAIRIKSTVKKIILFNIQYMILINF